MGAAANCCSQRNGGEIAVNELPGGRPTKKNNELTQLIKEQQDERRKH